MKGEALRWGENIHDVGLSDDADGGKEYRDDVGRGGGSKIGKIMNKKSLKSTLLSDNTRVTTKKKTKPKSVASEAPQRI